MATNNEVKLKLAIEGGKVVLAEIDGVSTALDHLNDAGRKVKNDLVPPTQQIDKMGVAGRKAKDDLVAPTQQLDKMGATGQRVNDELAAPTQQIDKMGAAGRKAKDDLVAPTQQLETMGGASRKVKNDLVPPTQQIDKMGLSAKQTAAALRGVPAQFTDIVTSLQGGQAPLQVLLQQGGQLKDMFGGAGNAAKAMGGYLIGLVNPYTGAAAAAAALGYVWYKGAAEAREYNKALILSGNTSGATALQMREQARAIAASSSASTGAAAEAVTQFVRHGNIASEKIQGFASTSVSMQQLTGVAVSDTVKQFSELGKAPVEASLKLNETTGYLTAGVYEQIKALMDQGRTLEAGALAQQTYADAMNSRMPQLEDNLLRIEKWWNAISKSAKEAWAAMIKPGDPLEDATKRLADVNAPGVKRNIYGPSLAQEKAELQQIIDYYEHIAASEKDYAAHLALQNKQLAAGVALSKEADQYASKQVQMQHAIAKAQESYTSSSQSPADLANYTQAVAGIVDKYKDAAVAKKAAKSAADSYLESLDKQLFKEQQLTAVQTLGMEINLGLLGKLSEAKQNQLVLAALEVDKARAQAIAQTALDKAAAAQKKTSQAGLDDLFKTIDANEKVRDSYLAAQIAASSYLDTINRQAAREVSGVGKGTQYRANQAGLNTIEDKFSGQSASLLRDKQNEKITQSQYQDYLALANYTYVEEVAIYQKSVQDKLAAQADWNKGADEALANYLSATSDVAKQTESLVTKAFGGMEDALASFVKTEQLDFGNLADSIISDLIRIQVQQSITKPMAAAMQDAGGISGMFSAAKSFLGFENGGIMSSAGSLPLHMYAGGGVASSPQLAVFGEGRLPEAYVPLPDGRSIPVTMSGGGGGNSIVVNIIEAPGQGGTQRRRTESGVDILDVFVEKVKSSIAGDIASGSGAVPGALTHTYGLNRVAGVY
ncbi:MAG: phage tail length tape measure family protein [Rhodoferax sp.]|nr:phage tail length tape measure family protein [Rhodoferax sp.]